MSGTSDELAQLPTTLAEIFAMGSLDGGGTGTGNLKYGRDPTDQQRSWLLQPAVTVNLNTGSRYVTVTYERT
jgi:hypothetical protein